MTIFYVLKRMRQQWRSLTFLFVAVCLATSFAGLGPLYLRYTSEVLLDNILSNLQPRETSVSFVSREQYPPEATALIDDNLGRFMDNQFVYGRSIYSVGQSPCIQGDPDEQGNIPDSYCLQMFGVDDHFSAKINLVSGRLPSNAIRIEEPIDQDAYIVYIEGMVSREIADQANLNVGRSFTASGFYSDDDRLVANQVIITGIFEPADGADAFWSDNGMMETGATVSVGFGVTRYDFGLAMHLDVFESIPVTPTTRPQYIHYMTLDTTAVDATVAREIEDALSSSGTILSRMMDTNVRTLAPLVGILSQHRRMITDTEGAIIALSFMLLALILYNFVSTTSMVFFTQANEWTMLRSRGSSTLQLLPTQLLPAVIMAGLAYLLTGVLTRGLLTVMTVANRVVNGSDQHLDIINRLITPDIVFQLSLATSIICGLLLLVPIFQSERGGILAHKQHLSRPVTKAPWASMFLDVIFISIGFMLLLRLYYLSEEGTLTAFVRDLFGRDTSTITDITSTSRNFGQYTDPFSLVAPIFLLTGSALLWLRVFPMLMKAASASVDGLRKLGIPLAVWYVERNSGHYRQFALLLVGTLAIGTASVSLLRTQQNGALQLALAQTGAHANLSFDGERVDTGLWRNNPDVAAYTEFMHVVIPARIATANEDVHVIGVDPETFAQLAPEMGSAVQKLQEIPRPGLELPTDARQLTVDVWAESTSRDGQYGEANVAMTAYLYDSQGIGFEASLLAVDNIGRTPVGEWLTFDADLRDDLVAPFYLFRIGVKSRHPDRNQFSQTLYLTNWHTIADDGSLTPLAVNPEQQWEPAQSKRAHIADWLTNIDPVRDRIDGLEPSWVDPADVGVTGVESPILRLEYGMVTFNARTVPTPSMVVNVPPLPSIPAVLSDDVAQTFRGQDDQPVVPSTPALQVGDERLVSFDLESSGNLRLQLGVVEVIEQFPTFLEPSERFVIILPIHTMQILFNEQYALSSDPQTPLLQINTAWVNFHDIDPPPAFEKTVQGSNAFTNAIFATRQFDAILNQPIPNTVAGLFFAGFWVSLTLSLLNFMLYISVTSQQRIVSFGVLRSLGWNINHIWRLMFMEQTVLFIPTVIIGTLLGIGLAFLLLPFLALPGNFGLQLPIGQIVTMTVILSASFLILLSGVSMWLRQVSVATMLRLGED